MTQQTYTPEWSKAPTDANWHARDNDGPVLDHDAALDNWRDTLTVRPFQHRDIPQNLSDYFTGKTPFITAYVDLLLARMANEERFSDAVCVEESKAVKDYDVIVFEYDSKCVYAVVNQAFDYRIFVTVCAELDLIPMSCLEVDTNIVVVRTITELEAVEFRAAMEAVYG